MSTDPPDTRLLWLVVMVVEVHFLDKLILLRTLLTVDIHFCLT